MKAAVSLLSLAALTGGMAAAGQKGVPAEKIAQPAWRVWTAEAGRDGVYVETVEKNLLLLPGASLSADSEESREFSAERARDGVSDDSTLRWSSANDWEQNDHWLQASFREPVTVGAVRIFWERTNAAAYSLEYSQDGKSWETAAQFSEAPQEKVQEIVLDKPVEASFVRLHVTDVKKDEADLSLYYQNVSVLELEIYEGIEDSFLIKKPVIGTGKGRTLEMPEAEGYEISFAGADYENLIDGQGRIADTIADTQAEIGFALEKDGGRAELPGMDVTIPAAQEAAAGTKASGAESDGAGAKASGAESDGTAAAEKERLPDGFSAMEWAPESDSFFMEEAELAAAEKALRESEQLCRAEEAGKKETLSCGRIQMCVEPWDGGGADPLGQEGFEIGLGTEKDGEVQIMARTKQGLCWGMQSLRKLWAASGGNLPAGVLRDYPRYSVRGFGIDVGRRAVSLEFLYRVVDALAEQRMNTLLVHLNDNQIISQSSYDGTTEGARSLYAGFRLESEIKNEAGEGLSSQDLFYTKEEFAALIAYGADRGVDVVPEIDTPAHSLSITKLFPKLGLKNDPEAADQLDLSKPETTELVKQIWAEYLTGADAAFAEAKAVHIGMDEYFGDADDYLRYMEELSGYVQELAPDKKVRMWGSLSGADGDYSRIPRSVEMHVWDTAWADPEEMYEAGFPIINSLSSSLYLIPGGGYDRLDTDFLEKSWQPNVFETAERTWELPAYSPRMLGACYMMWNDWAAVNGESITEDGLFERFEEPLAAISEKLWG